jgi:hypothetical protein
MNYKQKIVLFSHKKEMSIFTYHKSFLLMISLIDDIFFEIRRGTNEFL